MYRDTVSFSNTEGKNMINLQDESNDERTPNGKILVICFLFAKKKHIFVEKHKTLTNYFTILSRVIIHL